MNVSDQRGFTLIELMIVVAIIAILATIALPAYQDYVIRSQVSGGLVNAGGIRLSVRKYYAERGSWPVDNASLAITDTVSGTYVSSVTNAGGLLTITYGNNANSSIIGLTLGMASAVNSNGDVAWVCGSRSAPAGFTAVADPSTVTTLLDKHVPSNCRA